MVTPVEDRKGHDRRYSLDDSLLRALGYAPQVSFGQGLRATVQWYRDNRRWWEPLKRSRAGGPSVQDPIAVATHRPEARTGERT